MGHSPSDARPIFAGEFRHALDTKNRITIPSRWRNGDSDDFFLIRNPLKECLTVMPPEIFKSLGEEAKARIEPAKRQDFIRHLYAEAQQAASDKQGRLLITDEHCRAANLKGEVVLTGSMDRFEIWSPASWAKFREAERDNYTEVAKQIGL